MAKVQFNNVLFDSERLDSETAKRLSDFREWLRDWTAARGPALADGWAKVDPDKRNEVVPEDAEWHMVESYVNLMVHEFATTRVKWSKSGTARAADGRLEAVFRTLTHVVGEIGNSAEDDNANEGGASNERCS